MTALSREQYEFLIRPIVENRVQHLRGQAHLEAWDIRRHLIRVFGFDGYDIETKALDLVREIEYPPGALVRKDNKGQEYANDRTVWTVVYRAEVRLVIKDAKGRPIAVFEDAASGDSQNQPSLGDAHDQAMKTALSQGLKRCAVNLGDQFGMSLYNGGSSRAVVVRSLVTPDRLTTAPAVQDDAPVQPEQPTVADTRSVEPPDDDPDAPPEPPADQGTMARAAKAIAEATTPATLQRISRGIVDAVKARELTTGEEVELRKAIAARRNELAAPPSGFANQGQLTRLHTLFGKAGLGGEALRQERLERCTAVIGREITTTNELSSDEAETVIAALQAGDKAGAVTA